MHMHTRMSAHTLSIALVHTTYARTHTPIQITSVVESGKAKCAQYWPMEKGSSQEYGDVEVYVCRAFSLSPRVQTNRFARSESIEDQTSLRVHGDNL